MKIVYCIYDHFSRGGTERILSIKCNGLVERGHEVFIIDTFARKEADSFFFSPKILFFNLSIPYQQNREKNIVIKIFRYPLLIWKHYWRLNKLIREIKPDILISTNGHEAKLIPLMRLECKKVLEAHHNKGYKTIELENRSLSLFQKVFLKYLDQFEAKMHKYYDVFVVLTERDRQEYGIPVNSIVIPNPQTLISTQKGDLINHQAISLGRLSYLKGYDRLIDVWASVNEVLPDWRLDIFGEGEECQVLKEKIKRKNLEGKIQIHPFTKNIEQKLLEHSIYILSSRHEGFGLVLLEAMECGLPCIAFDCMSGPSEIITNQEDGILVADGDIDAMTHAIVDLAKNVERRKLMGGNAKRNVQRFSERAVLDRWEMLFNKLVKE